MNNLTNAIASRTPGRPTRETTILADKCKTRKRKKIVDSLTGDLTIFAQGDARARKKPKNWEY